MRRSYFFLLDKLKITSAERKLMIILITTLTLLSLLSIILPQQENTDPAEYAKLQQKFEQRSLLVHKDSVEKMERYLPPENPPEPEERQQREQHDEKNNRLKQDRNEQTATTTLAADNEGKMGEEPKKNSTDEQKPQKIDVNSADRKTLQLLPGIGPAYSERIINYRRENGPFAAPEELKNVKGIGPKTLENIMPLLDKSTFRDN